MPQPTPHDWRPYRPVGEARQRLVQQNYWVLVIAGLMFVGAMVLLVPWPWQQPWQLASVAAEEVLSPSQLERARSVSGELRVLGLARLVLGLVFLTFVGFSRTLSAWIGRWRGYWWWKALLAVTLTYMSLRAVGLPLRAWQHRILVREELSVQPWGPWLGDQAKGLGVQIAMTSLMVIALIGLMRYLPRWWPIAASVGAVVVVFIGSLLYPVVVEPVFNSFTSLESGPLRTQIMELGRAEQVQIDDVLVADASQRTTTLNAYVSGLGPTKRVVLYDTLLDGVPEAEIVVIAAHELAHAKHRDVLVGTTIGATGAGFGVGLLAAIVLWRQRRHSEPHVSQPETKRGCRGGGVAGRSHAWAAATLGTASIAPLLVALIAWGTFVASPVENYVSRSMEARADWTALHATADPAEFIAIQQRLAVRSKADPAPPGWYHWWFGTHPTMLERIGMAHAWERTQIPQQSRAVD